MFVIQGDTETMDSDLNANTGDIEKKNRCINASGFDRYAADQNCSATVQNKIRTV